MIYIVVLGNKNKSISLERVDKAVEVFNYMKHKGPEIIMCGGVTTPGDEAEAITMKKYAVEVKKIPAGLILVETKSKNTIQNITYMLEMTLMGGTERHDYNIVTSESHVIRCFFVANILNHTSNFSFYGTGETITDEDRICEHKSLERVVKTHFNSRC